MKLALGESHTIKANLSSRRTDTSIDIIQNENYEFTAEGCRVDLSIIVYKIRTRWQTFTIDPYFFQLI